MNLNLFMEQGIAQLVQTVSRYYLNSPKGIAFVARIAPQIRKSARRRQAHEQAGTHVPPLLIASITAQCNLHCAGCYARANGGCTDHAESDLTAAQWRHIFQEASDLGVSFVLLAGGEPLVRKDVIECAAAFPNMVFPIFTNGTLMDDHSFALFEENRNLIPVFSIEGDAHSTDARRGSGVHQTITQTMQRFTKSKILFGTSITVTRENIHAVAHPDFVQSLHDVGCGLLFFVEYVPAQTGTEHLMLQASDVANMQDTVSRLKQRFSDMILVSFPGDENLMGGCLASGRGFFHVSASGNAEPCPFSPHSELNLKTASIETVLRSEFFQSLRALAARTEHTGGCTLFDHKHEVAALLGHK